MKKILLAPLLLLSSHLLLSAQEGPNDSVNRLVENQHFLFTAQSAHPLRGRVIQLDSRYSLSVSKDTIDADLPYFGRAYVAPIDPSEGGIRFQSTKFDYEMVKRKKGGWDITIRPKDARDVRLLQMTISESGYASLQVSCNNREPISFRGTISKP